MFLEKSLCKLEGQGAQKQNGTKCCIINYRATGWIPEEILFDEIENKESLWTRLFANFCEGNILLAVGLEDTVTAVLGMKEENGQALMLCRGG